VRTAGAHGLGVVLEQKDGPAWQIAPRAAPTPADTGINPSSPPFPKEINLLDSTPPPDPLPEAERGSRTGTT